MDWNRLTKEQKQITMLVGIILIGVIIAFYQFVLKPLMGNWQGSSTELAELQTQVHKADLAIRGEKKLHTKLVATENVLREATDEHIPWRANPLAWVTERVYRYGREANVEVDRITEITPPGTGTGVEKEAFSFYRVRIIVQASFEEVLSLVTTIENSNPYAIITGISIASQQNQTDKHTVSLEVEWPIWTSSDGPKSIRTSQEKKNDA